MDYARLKSSADRMLANAKQGTIEIGVTTNTPGATELDAPTISTVWVEYDGAARGVSSTYVDGETILSTDLMAIIEADAGAEVGGMARVDNVVRQMIRVDKIPAAGTTVAKRVFLR